MSSSVVIGDTTTLVVVGSPVSTVEIDTTDATISITRTNATVVIDGSAEIVTINTQGPQGPPGAGAYILALEFEWNNATTRAIGTIPAGSVIVAVTVGVLTEWQDETSAVSVGTAGLPSLYFPPGNAELTLAGEYVNNPLSEINTDTTAVLSITAGVSESSGRGFVLVEYQPSIGV